MRPVAQQRRLAPWLRSNCVACRPTKQKITLNGPGIRGMLAYIFSVMAWISMHMAGMSSPIRRLSFHHQR